MLWRFTRKHTFCIKRIVKMTNVQQNRGTTCDVDSSYDANKLIYPAASRNKDPILQVLKDQITKYFPKTSENLFFLEVSSGSGQHVAHFAPHFPKVTFQPSEYEADLLGSINIYAEECPTQNINMSILVDICKDLSMYNFKEKSIDIIFNANMIHISPLECTKGLFANAGKYLKDSGMMITYGPYAMDGKITPESNVTFDESLRTRDPRWGLRDVQDLTSLASLNNISLKDIVDMPSNNKCLVWIKDEE